MLLLAVPLLGHHHPGADAAADDGEKSDRGDDQLELALLGGCGFCAFRRCAAFLFVVRHGPPHLFREAKRVLPACDAIRNAGANAPPDDVNAKVIMVNGFFLLADR